MKRLGGVGLALVLALVALFATTDARAHATPTSALLLDIRPNDVDAELDLPIDQLSLAYGRAIDANAPIDPALAAWLTTYLPVHVQLSFENAPATWTSTVTASEITRVQGNPEARVQMRFVPPAGTTAKNLVVFDDAILEHVVTHRTVISIRRDFGTGKLEPEAEVVGLTLFSQKSVVIQREGASSLRGFGATVQLGIRHIAEGTDHLLFILMLLLTAPLAASGEGTKLRWASVRTTKHSLRAVAVVVSAFTLGHSLSLAITTLGWLHPNARAVETLVAASILVTAVHAIRPVVGRREAWIAGSFGLVHGFAFAGTLSSFGFHGSTLALALVGFNLGIELMQLVVVAAALPFLLLLRQRPAYRFVRIGFACLGLAAAGLWMVSRITA